MYFPTNLPDLNFVYDPTLAKISPEDARQDFAGADIRMRDTDYFPFPLRNIA